MAMIVRNNMGALHALNTLNKNNGTLGKQLKRVSSGMRINDASDDASGYAISERMRVQVRALDQDERNTQTGGNLLRVAEGTVSGTVDILRTMKEKAVNAANDTNTDVDRATLQKEYDQLIDQIDDNANVNFNGKYLVDGTHNRRVAATQTSLTNSSLSTGTTGQTAFSAMQNRQNESLGIDATDTVEISWVKNGETHTASVTGAENFDALIAAANAKVATGGTTITIPTYTVHGLTTTNPNDIKGYTGNNSWTFSIMLAKLANPQSPGISGAYVSFNFPTNAFSDAYENYMESTFYNVGPEDTVVPLPSILQGVFDGYTFSMTDPSQPVTATSFIYRKISDSGTYANTGAAFNGAGIGIAYLLDASGNYLRFDSNFFQVVHKAEQRINQYATALTHGGKE